MKMSELTEMKTSELTRHALDWAVAYAKVFEVQAHCQTIDLGVVEDYSTDWSQGGPIIEREGIELVPSHDGTRWYSEGLNRGGQSEGPTPLIAAMRCYVANKLGDEVDVPEELIKQANE
jgi:Protein of unknown function (DUF2591)